MKNLFIKAVATSAILMSSLSAYAVPITGDISFVGSAEVTYGDSYISSIDFPSAVVWSSTGSFSDIAQLTNADFSAVVSDGSTATADNDYFWSVGDFTFSITDVAYNNFTHDGTLNSLILNGALDYTGTEFDYETTAGLLRLNGTELNNPGSFTFSAVTVPEPTTVALLGLGLVGFAASRRKKQA